MNLDSKQELGSSFFNFEIPKISEDKAEDKFDAEIYADDDLHKMNPDSDRIGEAVATMGDAFGTIIYAAIALPIIILILAVMVFSFGMLAFSLLVPAFAMLAIPFHMASSILPGLAQSRIPGAMFELLENMTSLT